MPGGINMGDGRSDPVRVPLRAVLGRVFVAYEGTHITLVCGHVIVRSRDTRSRQMRCHECALDDARERFLNAMGETVDLSHLDAKQ